jgi:hypothetical protein
MMASVAGAQFLLIVLFAPRHGVLARLIRNFKLAVRIVGEDILASIYRREEAGAEDYAFNPAAQGLSPFKAQLASWLLVRRGFLYRVPDGQLLLTTAGRRYARSIVRSHRLWEAFLGKNFELPLDHLHEAATRMEHFIGPELQSELAAELKEPRRDPHGRAIPSSPPAGTESHTETENQS